MNFKQDIIAHTFRNKYLKYTGGSYTTSKASSTTDYTATQIANWFYEDDNGNLHSRLSFVGDKEISAYGVGDDSGTGSVTIIDNLLSNAADCALSANQGRVLNEKIEDIIEQGVGGVTSWDDLEDKPALLTDENIQKWNTQTHTHSNKTVLDGITSAKTTNWDSAYTHISDTTKHITSAERTSWNNKLDKSVWDKAFYYDSDNNLRVKVNVVGEKEISAYGIGESGGSGAITIVDNLTSTQTDCALSANQGRILKGLIDDKVSTWDDLEGKPSWIGSTKPSYSWSEITGKPSTFTPSEHTHNYTSTIKIGSTSYNVSANTVSLPAYPTLTDLGGVSTSTFNSHTGNTTLHITSTERTNWNTAYNNNHTHSNKSVLDGITSTKVGNWDGVVTNWNKAFYFDSNNNLRVKLNLVGEGEVSAYGAGTSGTGIITIVDNLTSTATDCALSANQGRVLKGLIDSKVSSWNDIKDKPSTFTPSTHTHNYASTVKVGSTSYNVNSNIISLPAYPTTLKNPNALTISLNGTSQGAYDGSTAKSINITASSVGAAASSHTHTISQITNLQSTLDSKLNSSAYTAADILSKLKTVDGSGSGLDADTLDGVHNGFVSGRLHTYSLPYTNSDKKNYWVKIATLKLTSQYTSQEAILLISEGYTLTSNSYYAFVSVRIQQQNSMGNIPNVSLKAFGSISNSNIVGILNYNSSSSTLDVYYREVNVYQKGYVSYVQGTADIRTNSQELIATLPSGTQIISTNDCRCGYSDNADKLDGVQLNGIFTALSSSSGTNLSATIGGVTKSIADLYATQAVNADMLDGYHLRYNWNTENVAYIKLATIKISSAYVNTPVEFRINGRSGGDALISVRFDNYNGTDPRLISFTGYGIYSGYIDRLKIYKSATSTWEIWLTSQTQSYDSGQIYAVYVPGGFSFTVNGSTSTTLPTYSTSYTCSKASIYGNIAGNSSTATKLQTARTIWGHSFNGTANVSGNIIDTQAVKSKSGVWLDLYGANGVAFYTNNTVKAAITTSGNFGIGTSSPSQKLHVNGNILSTGEITAYSDARLKSNIQTLQDRGYITPVTYIKDGKQSIGFLAQEVREKYPELVTEDTNEEKYLSLNYAQYTAVLQAQIIQLNMRIKQLESKL